ncbi:MAG: hypothetical protein F4X27_16510, partial [Chloroflexi bacterium]|nr:hypothetical protein [Chloroflexota bacterium]
MTDATAGLRLDGGVLYYGVLYYGVLYYGGVAGITHGEAVALRMGTAPRSQWCRRCWTAGCRCDMRAASAPPG